MKKTVYTMLVSAGFYKNEIWRRVWQDDEGNYVVKVNGEWVNVNHAEKSFVKD